MVGGDTDHGTYGASITAPMATRLGRKLWPFITASTVASLRLSCCPGWCPHQPAIQSQPQQIQPRYVVMFFVILSLPMSPFQFPIYYLKSHISYLISKSSYLTSKSSYPKKKVTEIFFSVTFFLRCFRLLVTFVTISTMSVSMR